MGPQPAPGNEGLTASSMERDVPTPQDLLTNTYHAFNARDIESVLAVLHPEVDWPNGWEGGRVYGREAVRDYWTRQWEAIDPHVEPVGFDTDETGRTVVTVHQVVRDLDGNQPVFVRRILTVSRFRFGHRHGQRPRAGVGVA